MSGKIKNRTRRALTFNLTTTVAPVRHLFARRTEHKNGTVSVTDRRLVLPDSVTILARDVSESLPDGVPHCPEVAAAIARRDVIWVPDPVAQKAEPATSKGASKAEPAPTAEPEPKAEPDGPKARSRRAG